MDFLNQHSETAIGMGFAMLPFLLPAVNKFLARITGNRAVKYGLKVADAIKDGKLSIDDVQGLLAD
ncbi:MAG: hypothetical protein AAF921_25805 [Cyanobacteria bacterium P01_D01_bin.44]